MTNWWLDREPRERGLLVAGGIVVVITLCWLLIWEPLKQRQSALEKRVAQQQRVLLALSEMAPEVAALRAAGAAVAPGEADGRTLLSIADTSVRAAGLAGALRRIEPDGDSRVSLWLELASFDQAIGWLERLASEHGIRAESLNTTRSDQTGLVNMQLSLIRRG